MYEHVTYFLWYPHATTSFFSFLDIFTLKTFNLHAVYVGFHLQGTLKLQNYVYILYIIIIIYIYYIIIYIIYINNTNKIKVIDNPTSA